MISLNIIIALLFMHFVADFIFQSDKVAIAKSSDNMILAKHVAIYSIPFFWFGVTFALVNALAHLVTDYASSRATSYLYNRNERHWFFVVIGLDQFIHAATLFSTYVWLVK